MPYIYFCVLLIFLFLYSFFITLQLYRSIKFELAFRKIVLIQNEICSWNQLFYNLRILSYKKLWFRSIKLVESQIVVPNDKEHQYFNAVGFIYQSMKKYELAKLYYLRSLDRKKNYLTALKNLLKMESNK